MSPDKEHADAETVAKIRELASMPHSVRVTDRAQIDLEKNGWRKGQVCEVICKWIDAGRPVQRGETKHVAEHAGAVHYVMKPEIDGRGCYVKVTLRQESRAREWLLIISAHPHA